MENASRSPQAEKIATSQLGPIEETLVIPLLGRALEQSRRRPLLLDSKAEDIVSSLDYEFSKFTGPTLRGAVLRTRIYDRLVSRWMNEHPGGTVVELGCGLNTRYERIDDGRVRWFDLDVPNVVSIWHRFFKETDRRRSIASSAFETEWMELLAAESEGPFLFVSEASTLYFSKTDNQKLYEALATRFPGAQVLFDTATQHFVANQDSHDALRHCTARVSWIVEEESDLQSMGLLILERFPLFRPTPWLRSEIPLFYRLFAFILRMRHSQAVRSYHINLARLSSDPARTL